MKPQQISRMAVDLSMTVLLLLLMAFMITGQMLHEIFGTILLVLFIAHNILNRRWLKNIGHGKYTPFRVLQTVLVLLVLLTMLAEMVSGILMSRYVFSFLPRHGGMAAARTLHLLGAYWGFIFMSLHLGLHWNMICGMVSKTVNLKKLRVLAFAIAIYGGFAFYKQQIAQYLFLRQQFVFFDTAQSPIAFFAENLAMMGLWVLIAYYAAQPIQKKTTRRLQ